MKPIARGFVVALLALAPAAFAYQAGTVQNDDVLRKKASVKGKALAVVHKQEKVEVKGCRKGWCLVEIDVRAGWMPQANLWLHEPSAGPGVTPAPTHPGADTFHGVPTYAPGRLP